MKTSMWKPPNWNEPTDELGRYVFGVSPPGSREGGEPQRRNISSTRRSSEQPPRTEQSRPAARSQNTESDRRNPTSVSRRQTDSKHLAQNSRDGHAPERKRVICKTCNRSFFDKSTLNRHVAVVHEKKKPVACNVCGKRFAKNSMLKHHIAVSPFLDGIFFRLVHMDVAVF